MQCTIPASSPKLSLADRLNHGRQLQRHHGDGKRVTCFHWNSGGLTAGEFDEMLTILQTRGIDIATISETHWNLNKTWSSAGWHVHHSSSSNKGDGLMILISSRRWSSQCLGWEVISPGRLVHIRIRLCTTHLDSIHCYQYADRHDSKRKQERHSWWQALDRLLTTLPKRNYVLLQGDFNCSLPHCPGLVGLTSFPTSTGPRSGPAHHDMHQFSHIIRQHKLVALNTWSTTQASYRHQDQLSRIDHIFTRLDHADPAAKHVHHDWDFPLIQHPDHSHFPQITSIPCARRWKPPPTNTITLQQRLRGRLAALQCSESWMDFQHDSHLALSTAVDNLQPECTEHSPVETIHACLLPPFQRSFGTSHSRSVTPNSQYQSKWQHRWKATHQPCTLFGIFRGWFHWTQFRNASRDIQKVAQHQRELRAQQLICDAQQASDKHDQFHLYRLINQYSPKVSQVKIQLKQNGCMLTPQEAHQHLVEYVRTTWAGPDDSWYVPQPLQSFPFTREELEAKLLHTPSSKAVAPGCVPGSAIHPHATMIAHALMPLLYEWWTRSVVHIPQEWKASWVIWLAKPKKQPNQASHLRAIALQEPIGKQVLGLLIDKSLPQTLPTFQQWPQYAFIPQRGTAEALLRVQQHCSEVRDLLAISHRHVKDRAQGKVPSKMFGGVQVSLDMTRAFDCLNREYLFTRLATIGLDRDLCQLLSAWHTGTKYHVTWEGHTDAINTYIGVRQGCKGAPYLWCCLIVILLQDLTTDPTNPITRQWVLDHITFYADDLHVGCVIKHPKDFTQFIQFVGILIDKLQGLGLTISAAKSTAMMSLRGTHCTKLSHPHIRQNAQGRHLLITVGAEVLPIPLVKTFVYLGTVLSYGAFELQTTKHRIQAAWQAFHRLRRWLLTGRLKFCTRHSIWQSSILSILLYGLWPIGINEKCVMLLMQTMFTMLRRMLHNHAYHTGDTHQSILHKHHLEHPCLTLRRAICAFRDRIEARQLTLSADDIVASLNWHHLHSIIAILTHHAQDPPPIVHVPLADDSVAMHPTFACSHCTLTCNSIANLRRHMTQAHGIQVHRTSRCNPGLHAVNGLPHCSHCGQEFASWRAFETHLERSCCSRPLQEPMNQPHVPSDRISLVEVIALKTRTCGQRLLTMISHRNWSALKDDSELLTFLQHQCCICGFWFDKTQQYIAHVKHRHPRLLKYTLAKSTQLTKIMGGHSPCALCGGSFKQSHLCVVATQVAKLYVHGAANDASTGDRGIASRLTCDICNTNYSTEKDLAHHLCMDHQLWTHNWVPSRDIASPNSTQCAHCARDLGSMPNLRAHITSGYCPDYNPARLPESQPLPDFWVQEMKAGRLEQALKTEDAGNLTTQCLHCGEHYTRVQDLSAHIQQCHGLLLEDSSAWISMLTSLMTPITQCVCRPMTVGTVNHQCLAWIQLGMVCTRAKLRFVLPYTITMPHLQMKLSLTAVESHPDLCRLLVQRDFETLWTSLEVLQGLSQQCYFCGEAMDAAQLHWHLMLVHHSDLQWAGALLPLILPLLHSICAGHAHCKGCGLMYQLPPDLHSMESTSTDLLNLHLRFQCPVSLQLSLLLSLPNHGRRRCSDGLGQHARGVPVVQTHGSPPGKPAVRPPWQRNQTSTAPRTGLGSRSRSHRREDSAQDRSGPGSLGTSPRTNNPELAPTRLIHHFLQPRFPGHPAPADCPNPTMERPSQPTAPTIILDDLEAPPGPPPADHSPPESSPNEQMSARGPADPTSPGEEGPDCRWMLSVPSLGQAEEQPSPGQQAGHRHEEDATNDRLIGGSHDRDRRDDRGLPCTEIGQLSASDPMAPSNLNEETGVLLHLEGSMREPNLADPGCQLASTHPTAIPTSPDSGPPDRQRQGEGEEQEGPQDHASSTCSEEAGPLTKLTYRIHLLLCTLRTSGHYCYANATFLAWMWMHMSRKLFQWSDLGSQADDLRALLTSGDTLPFRLIDAIGMRSMLVNWEEYLGAHGQSDAGEFLTYMLNHVHFRSPCYQMQWHRRELRNAQAKVMDRNAPATITKLQFDLATMHQPMHLNDLLQTWTEVDGMVTAFVKQQPQMICFHLDRLRMTDEDTWTKVYTQVRFDGTIRVPCFQDDTMTAVAVPYQAISATCHLGSLTGGHYVSLMRLSTHTADTWIMKDDNVPPAFCETIPEWFSGGWTTVWLVPLEEMEQVPIDEVLPLLRGTRV
eukprot:Skav222129  [mRNA]  locus=scaffold1181:747034:753600:- [translate_table: standard]